MKKQVRWKCERCGDGLLAPSKPRRNDVRRYCLPCSSETGRLVERIAPALEQHRARRVEAAQQKKKSERIREKARIERKMNAPREVAKRKYSVEGEHGMNIKNETARLWRMIKKMPQEVEWGRRGSRTVSTRKPPKVVLMKRGWSVDKDGQVWTRIGGYAGLAYGNHISIKPGVSWETLAHEIIHCAGFRGHDETFYAALKWLTEKRFGIKIDFSSVTRYGYDVDRLIDYQIEDVVEAEFEKKIEEVK
jgi:hypothetical protein